MCISRPALVERQFHSPITLHRVHRECKTGWAPGRRGHGGQQEVPARKEILVIQSTRMICHFTKRAPREMDPSVSALIDHNTIFMRADGGGGQKIYLHNYEKVNE